MFQGRHLLDIPFSRFGQDVRYVYKSLVRYYFRYSAWTPSGPVGLLFLSFCDAFSILSGVNGGSIFYLIFLRYDKVKTVIINVEWLFWHFGVDFPYCLIIFTWIIFVNFYIFEFFIYFSSFYFLGTLFLSFLSCCLCCLF